MRNAKIAKEKIGDNDYKCSLDFNHSTLEKLLCFDIRINVGVYA
jgi:hypothetical protein